MIDFSCRLYGILLILAGLLIGCTPRTDTPSAASSSPLTTPNLEATIAKTTQAIESTSPVTHEATPSAATRDLGLLAGIITGLDTEDSASLYVRPLTEEGTDALGRVELRFNAGNGRWQQTDLTLEPGRYELVPEAESYVSIPGTTTFQVPEGNLMWRYTLLDFEFLHPENAPARFGVPLCPELPPYGGTYIVPQGEPSPTPDLPSLAPTPASTPMWPPGTCYAGHFHRWAFRPAGLRGQVSGLPSGQMATIMLYALPPVPGENYVIAKPPPCDGSWAYPPAVASLGELPEIADDWHVTATLTTANGPWGLVDPSLVAGKYLVTAQAAGWTAQPAGYEVVVFGGKLLGIAGGVDFAFRPETASPLPVATTSEVQVGQSSVATAQRDGLSLELRLPKGTYLAGESVRAAATLHNEGSESVMVDCDRDHSSWLVLLDEQGHGPDPWPWVPMSGPGLNRCFGRELAPGQVLTDTLTLQLPPDLADRGQSYNLWAETWFSRSAPDLPQGSEGVKRYLEAGPIPLQVIPPQPAQHLVAELLANREGWHLRVTDTDGHAPPGPLWGFKEVASFNSVSVGPLRDSADGTWSATWRENEWDDESEICLRAWVTAPDYVTVAVTETIPGTANTHCMFHNWPSPRRQTFPALEEAQAATEFPLYRPNVLPGGVVLDSVQVETWSFGGDGYEAQASQMYRLPDGAWLELAQKVRAEPWAGFGWGQARHDPEAHTVAVGQTTGYAIQRFGRWLLDWKCGDVGLELRVPVESLSLEELVAIAAGVQSPEGTCPPAPTPAPPAASPAPPTPAPTPTG